MSELCTTTGANVSSSTTVALVLIARECPGGGGASWCAWCAYESGFWFRRFSSWLVVGRYLGKLELVGGWREGIGYYDASREILSTIPFLMVNACDGSATVWVRCGGCGRARRARSPVQGALACATAQSTRPTRDLATRPRSRSLFSARVRTKKALTRMVRTTV